MKITLNFDNEQGIKDFFVWLYFQYSKYDLECEKNGTWFLEKNLVLDLLKQISSQVKEEE